MGDTQQQESDFGTPETQKQGGGITKGYATEGGKVARVKHQSPIDVLYHRHRIDDRQWEGAERLRNDAQMSGKFSYVKSSADFSVKGNRDDEPAECVVRASKRYNDALSMLSNEEKSIVLYVVIEEGIIKWISDYKLRQTAVGILCGALDKLVKFYGV
jgi:hypothetical protein